MIEEPETFDRVLAGGRYKVARNPLGTVPNAPSSSAPDKEPHPPDVNHASDAWRPG